MEVYRLHRMVNSNLHTGGRPTSPIRLAHGDRASPPVFP